MNTRKIIALSIASAVVGFLYPWPAHASTFNTPDHAGGTSKQQDTYLHDITSAINATPKGATVSVSTYSNTSTDVTDALIKADRRGVHIHYVTWDGDDHAQVPRLRKALGTNTRDVSWIKVCRGSCGDDGTDGVNHAKLVAISQTGSHRNRVFHSTQNLTGGGSTQWNEYQSIDDAKVYKAVATYISRLASDVDVKHTKSVASGGWHLDFLPTKSASFDPIGKTLKNTSCSGGAQVRVMMMIWTSNRRDIADRLVALRKKGCDVRAIIDVSATAPSVLRTLTEGHVPTWDAEHHGMEMHAKTVIVDAKVSGHRKHYVIVGSGGLNTTAYRVNTNTLLTLDSVGEVNQHLSWFDRVAKHSTRL